MIQSFERFLLFASSHIAVDFERFFCLPEMDILLSLSHNPVFKLELGIYPSPSTTTVETKLWFL